MIERGTVTRVYKQTDGGVLAQALTGTWTNGGTVLVEAATDFSPTGGDGVFEPGTDNEEAFSYSGMVINPSDALGAMDSITGVIRNNPVAHAKGTWIQEGDGDGYVEKMADVLVDGEMFTGVPIDPMAYTLYKVGTYTEDEAPVVPVEFSEEGMTRIIGGAAGAVPLVGADIETLPGTGDGNGTIDPGTGNPPPGQGWEDGEPPSEAPVLTAVGGVGFISLRSTSIENGSAVTYKFYGHTSAGFTEDDTTFIGSVRLSGEAGFLPSLTVKDFPTGHVLDGGANDPVKAGVTYRFTCVPYDGSGAGPTSNEVSATPVLIQTVDVNTGAVTEALLAANAVTETKIANDSITSPKIVARTIQAGDIATGTITANEIAADTITANEIAANAITSSEIAANTIVAGDIASGTITATQIAASTITADRLSISTLSAITANLGTVTAGTITGLTITGGTITGPTFQTASSGTRIAINSGSNPQRVSWFSSSTEYAYLNGDSAAGKLQVWGGNELTIGSDVKITGLLSGTSDLWVTGDLDVDGFIDSAGNVISAGTVKGLGLLVGTETGDPPSNYVRLYKDANNLMAKAPGRTAVVVAAL